MQKFMIDFEEVSEREFYEQLEASNRYECEDTYDDILDESEDEIEIFGCSYHVSQVWTSVDPTAYRCSLCDYESNRLEELKDDLDRWGKVTVDGCDFEIEEEDEEMEDED